MSGPHHPPAVEPFGAHIATLRREAGLSVAEAAAGAGMSPANWSAMERDGSLPTFRMLRPMAAILGVQPYEVL